MSKRILLWEPGFPDRTPVRLTVHDSIASALVRAGVAAAADPAEEGSLLSGGALSGATPTPVVLQHGAAEQRLSLLILPAAAAAIAIGLGLAASVGAATLVPTPPNSALSAGAWNDDAPWDDAQTWKDS